MSWLDLTDAKENGSFEALPEGQYEVYSDEAVVKQTKSGDGKYIQVHFKVLNGEHRNRSLFEMFNFENKSQKAVEIGIGKLKSFMRMAGKSDFKLKSPDELCGLKVLAIVKTRETDRGMQNTISYFKPLPKSEKSDNVGFY